MLPRGLAPSFRNLIALVALSRACIRFGELEGVVGANGDSGFAVVPNVSGGQHGEASASRSSEDWWAHTVTGPLRRTTCGDHKPAYSQRHPKREARVYKT